MKSCFDTYKETQIRSAHQGRLIVIVYDYIIKALNSAIKNISHNKYQETSKDVLDAQNALSELLFTLNTEEGDEISHNLSRLYKYFKKQLKEAKRSNDAGKIEPIIEIVRELRDAWDGISYKKVSSTPNNTISQGILNLIV